MLVRSQYQPAATWRPVVAFLTRTGWINMTPAEKARLYAFLARLVVRHSQRVARHSRIPVTLKLVVNCTANIGGLFEQQFPGYIKAGLAGVIARRLCKPQPIGYDD